MCPSFRGGAVHLACVPVQRTGKHACGQNATASSLNREEPCAATARQGNSGARCPIGTAGRDRTGAAGGTAGTRTNPLFCLRFLRRRCDARESRAHTDHRKRWPDFDGARLRARAASRRSGHRMTSDESSAARPGMFGRLKAGLARSAAQLTNELGGVFTKERLDADTIRDLEDALIRADVGTGLAHELAAEVGQGRYDTDIAEHELRGILADAIAKVLTPAEKPLRIDSARRPFVVLVAGVNGTGKTTTIGKLAAKLGEDGKRVLLAAGDTFRAAAIDQLKIWGERAHVPVYAGAQGADAAGLAFDALGQARSDNTDVLLIDT